MRTRFNSLLNSLPFQGKEATKGFTLVELIVVITILAILGTIAFISLQGYSASSRDSVRINDVSSMKTSLELFHLDAGKYPLPDNLGEVTYGGDLLWSQGTLGKTVVSQLSRSLNKIPTDPLTDKEYVYSVSWNKNDFQILNLLEGDLAYNATKPLSGILSSSQEKEATFLITQTNAANTKRTPRVDGKYNGLFLKTPNYIFPTPSLITSETISGGLEIDDNTIKSQITTGGENIPNIGNINSATGTLNIKLSVYTGVISGESDGTDKINAINAIKIAYSGSTLANSDIYKTVLEANGIDALVALADTIILDKTSKTVTQAPVDTESPTGGDFTMPTTTSSTSVTLTITCPEEEGVEMYISGTGVLVSEGNEWEECINGSKNIILTSGDGNKEITLKWRDGNGNETNMISKNINMSTVIVTYNGSSSTNGTTFVNSWNSIPNGVEIYFYNGVYGIKATKSTDIMLIRGQPTPVSTIFYATNNSGESWNTIDSASSSTSTYIKNDLNNGRLYLNGGSGYCDEGAIITSGYFCDRVGNQMMSSTWTMSTVNPF